MTYFIKLVEDENDRRDHERLRHDVYVREKGWISNAFAPGGRESDPFDSEATLITAYDLKGEPVGAIRLIHRPVGTTGQRLPVELDPFSRRLDGARSAVEVSRLAVAAAHRGNSLVMLGLCRMVLQEMEAARIDDCYAIVERPLLISLRAIGFPFRVLGEPIEHFGGLVSVVVAPVAELVPGAVKAGRFGDFFESPFNGILGEDVIAS